jgi:hypothetical protein
MESHYLRSKEMKVEKTKILELLAGKNSPKLDPKVAKMIADLLLLHAARMFKQALIDEEDPKIIKYYSSTAPARIKQIAARIQKGKPSLDDVEVELVEDVAEDTPFYDELERLLKRNKVNREALPPVFLGASAARYTVLAAGGNMTDKQMDKVLVWLGYLVTAKRPARVDEKIKQSLPKGYTFLKMLSNPVGVMFKDNKGNLGRIIHKGGKQFSLQYKKS